MSDFLALPLPKGVFFASASVYPCCATMHHTRRVSRSMTRSASVKYRGRRVYAPLTTPAPIPRSHCSRETCLGPRFCFQRSSPRAVHSSAGLPSCSAARYLAISSTAEPCASTAGIAITLSSATSQEPRRGKSGMCVLNEWEGAALLDGGRPALDYFGRAVPGGICGEPKGLGDRCLVGALVAAIVDPGDGDFLALRATLELERKKRIFRHRRPPLRGEHGLAAIGHRDALDEPGRNDRSLRVLALAGLHFVVHQHLDLGRIADNAGTDFHRICHVILRIRRVSL